MLVSGWTRILSLKEIFLALLWTLMKNAVAHQGYFCWTSMVMLALEPHLPCVEHIGIADLELLLLSKTGLILPVLGLV